ncbi:MAG: hypothetical protein GX974_03045, partial [Clostridiales bacterium]|nr:hypothetical protein [Clostridiales bacterium]
MKRLFCLIIALLLCISHVNISYASRAGLEGYEEIESGENISLLFNRDKAAIAIEDKRNGYIWRSIVDEDIYDMKSCSEVLRTLMSSMFVINYAATGTNNPPIQTGYTASDECTVDYRLIDGGIALEYEFKKPDIALKIEITVEDDALIVRIPNEDIKEGGRLGVVSIKALPFLGAADSETEGYILYPDGPGALMYHGSAKDRPMKIMKEFEFHVYGPREVSSEEYDYMERYQKHQAMLPIYGIKNNDNALLAITDEGSGGASINITPEGVAIDLNRVSFELLYRNSFDIMLSNITVHGSDVAKLPQGTRVDKNITKQDYELRYEFLVGKDANYSEMANVYRNFLTHRGMLRERNEKATNGIPLGIDFLMGVKEERILFDRFISMTTFNQAEEITDKLLNMGIDNLQINLKGYSKGGYGMYPINWPVDWRLGGKRGLKNYLDYANKKDIPVTLQTNFINALGESGTFSKSSDVVRQESGPPVSDDELNWFLLNPSASYKRLERFLKQVKGLKVGIVFEKIGERIYHDYNSKNPYSRMGTQRVWEDMMELTLKEKGAMAVEGGNAYTFKYADRLYNIPVETSQYHICDETVPFFQMVVHGRIPYSSEPGNLFYDDIKQKLKWIEYGCMPYFEL